MKFMEFFDNSTFTLFAVGDGNWDLYIMQYQEEKPSLVSIAKPDSGASDSFFGGLDYLDILERKGIKHGYVRV